MLNANATLIAEVNPGYLPPPLNPEEQKKVAEVYDRYGVGALGPEEKIKALQKEIQTRKFFAIGGAETKEMELRANERIYLLSHGC